MSEPPEGTWNHTESFFRHYDAGGYEEDMENDDEFGSDAERGKLGSVQPLKQQDSYFLCF